MIETACAKSRLRSQILLSGEKLVFERQIKLSTFKAWMNAMGFHGKQVGKAGEAIGMGSSTAQLRYRGEKDPDHMERLAMAAVTAGLPAWTPANHNELEACGKVIASVRSAFGGR